MTGIVKVMEIGCVTKCNIQEHIEVVHLQVKIILLTFSRQLFHIIDIIHCYQENGELSAQW